MSSMASIAWAAELEPNALKMPDQRKSQRVKLRSCLYLRIESPVSGRHAIGAARLIDISLLGASVCAELPLRKGQWVDVMLLTDGCPRDIGLPSHLHGRAVVRRVTRRKGRSAIAGLAFAPSLSRNLDFATYIAYLLEV